MRAMAIDFEKEFFDNINRQFEALNKKISEHIQRHEQDLKSIQENLEVNTNATKSLADHVAKQNGRIGKLERKKGKHVSLDNKTLTTLALLAIVFMVIVVAGKEGLGVIETIFK